MPSVAEDVEQLEHSGTVDKSVNLYKIYFENLFHNISKAEYRYALWLSIVAVRYMTHWNEYIY